MLYSNVSFIIRFFLFSTVWAKSTWHWSVIILDKKPLNVNIWVNGDMPLCKYWSHDRLQFFWSSPIHPNTRLSHVYWCSCTWSFSFWANFAINLYQFNSMSYALEYPRWIYFMVHQLQDGIVCVHWYLIEYNSLLNQLISFMWLHGIGMKGMFYMAPSQKIYCTWL